MASKHLEHARRAYNTHKSSAKRRKPPVEFKLTFQEWYDWWLSNGVDKDIRPPPRDKNTLCMCRYNDTGAYELGNIYCDTISQNARDWKANQNKKRIQTPLGVFPSRKAAAEAHGFKNPRTVSYLVKTKPNEWYYLP